MSQTLISKLAQVRRKQAMVFSATGAFFAGGLIVVALAVEMLCDWGVQWPWSDSAGLPWTVRAAILALILAGVVWITLNRIIAPWVFGPDDEALALAVERKETDLRGRLIASVQLSQPHALAADTSPTLVAALVRQTEQMVQDRDFDRIIRMDSLFRNGAISLLIFILGGLTFTFCRPGSAALLSRAFLGNDPVPRKTHVRVITGDIRVPKGESVTLVAQAEGVKPASGFVDIAYDNSDTRYTFTLDPDPDVKGQYSRKIDNVTTSFTYAVQLNDGRGDRRYNVQAVDRPIVLSMNCLQIYPDYVGLPDATHLPGDLTILAGSRLVITLKASKPLAMTSPRQFPFNHIHLSGSEKDYPLEVNAQNPTKAVTTSDDGGRGIPLPPGTTGLSVYLVDADGIESKAPTVYRVELVPDKPPVIRVTSSSEGHEEMVTRVATPQITFDAYDDYAIGRVSLRYTVNGGSMQEIPIPLNPARPRSISGGTFDFNLANITPPAGNITLEGSSIQYWLHAEDLNTLSNPNHLPGMGDSDHYVLKVVTPEEKRRELLSLFGIIPDQLTPITEGEQKSRDSLQNLIIQSENGSPTTQPSGKQ